MLSGGIPGSIFVDGEAALDFSFVSGIALQSISVVLSIGMILYFLIKGKPTPLLRSFVWCQVIILTWSAGQVLQFIAPNDLSERIIKSIEYFSICFIGVSWLLFCILYTNVVRRSNVGYIKFLFVPPVLFYLAVLSNDYHHLFFNASILHVQSYGPIFWVHTAVTYLYCVLGIVLLVRYSLSQRIDIRRQSLLIIFAVTIPIGANMAYLSGAVRTNLDITPVTFALSLMLFSVATFKYRFLNIIPIAFKRIVDNMGEAVVVVDAFNRVINVNGNYSRTLGQYLGIKHNDHVNSLVHVLRSHIEKTAEGERILGALKDRMQANASGELSFNMPQSLYYAVDIHPIQNKNEDMLGRIITFRDITEHKNLLNELNDKNEELQAMNEQLKEYASTAEKLAIANERNRFARDVHDTLGHSMTLLIALLEVSGISMKKDPAAAEEKLLEAANIAREGLRELRRSVRGIASEKLEKAGLKEAILSLAEDFRSSGVNVDVDIEGLEGAFDPEISNVVFRLCQEALTNSLRHGKARNVSLIFKTARGRLRIFIIDDGSGCKEIKPGLGLTGMEQRVGNIGGEVSYGSDGESGFNIRVEIPLEGRGVLG